MNNVTVIHFVHTLYGGVASVAATIITYQHKIGWKTVVVYVNDDPSFHQLVDKSTEMIQIKMSEFPGIYMCVGMRVKRIFKKYKKKHSDESVICHVHNIQALGALARWNKIPLICTLHSLNGKEASVRRKLSNLLYKIALIRLLKYEKPITSVSKAIVMEYAKIPGADKISIIYNGSDIDVNRRNEQLKFTIGFVGNLSYAKGWDIVFDAFCKIPEEIRDNMLLVAAGKESDFTFDLVKKMSLENGVDKQVECFGYITDAKNSFIPKLDVLVLASRNEGLGLVQIEAMGYGIPVLGTDVGGICEILKDGYNGFIISDSIDLSKKIEFLYRNKKIYKELSKNALLTYRSSFTQEIMCRKYIDEYELLLQNEE